MSKSVKIAHVSLLRVPFTLKLGNLIYIEKWSVTSLKTCLWERDLIPWQQLPAALGEVPGKKEIIQVSEFLLVSNLFFITTADLMAKRKARSPPASVSSCFRHYKQQGNVHALSLWGLLQFICLCWVDFQVVPLQNANVSWTWQDTAALWRGSCVSLLKRFLPKEKANNQ